MWPQVPVQTKVRILPWLLLVAVGLTMLGEVGGLPRPADATEARRAKAAKPSRAARADIPRQYLRLYQKAGRTYRIPWTVLAAIGKVESDHGRSSAPGVRSGVNQFGCCAGPMQFNLRNGPPSTWDAYGHGSPYDPADAIPAAARLLVANGARRDLAGAIYAYNHSRRYVAQVLALNHRYTQH